MGNAGSSDFSDTAKVSGVKMLLFQKLSWQDLLNRGYDKESIHKILSGNVMRVLRKAEDVF